ncbi:MAG: hypothetical protein D6160_07775 [Ketobacter sp.]|nr:MAG: hypothetical protein D6160_07775 [Ketobacter sp.]
MHCYLFAQRSDIDRFFHFLKFARRRLHQIVFRGKSNRRLRNGFVALYFLTRSIENIQNGGVGQDNVSVQKWLYCIDNFLVLGFRAKMAEKAA